MANELKVNRWVTLTPTVIDADDSAYTYYGYEAPNSGAGLLTQCSIKRVSLDTNLEEWAESDPFNFKQAWADRAIDLNYSTRKS
jgi:hypothetical protein